MLKKLPPSVAPIAMVGICALIQVGGYTLQLQYDQYYVAQAEYWRLLSGHFVHLNWPHFFLNIAALLLIWQTLFETTPSWQFTAATLWTSAVVGLALHYLQPEIIWYVGLSGSLHGLFVIGITPLLRRKVVFAHLATLVLIGKLIYEQTINPIGQSLLGEQEVIIEAHLYGASAGAVWAVIAALAKSSKSSKSSKRKNADQL